MYTLKTISVLALAATTVLAAPTPIEGSGLVARQWRGGNRFWTRPSPDAEITTWGYGGDSSDDTEDTSSPDSSSNYGPVSWGAQSSPPAAASSAPPAPVAPAAPSTPSSSSGGWSAAPSSAPAPSTAPSASLGGGGDWFTIANKWRVALGKPAWTESSKLVANAQDTADNSVGGLIHKLNPGTFAQVLAPGDASNFENVFVGGWLCELPNLPGLDGVCASASGGWNHEGQTGHAEILDGDYKSIGCALSSSTGVWACDLA